MKTKILEYIDFEKVNALLEGFNQSTGFVTAILDLEGNILSKSGWRHICTDFHRVNPETSKKCTISDTVLAQEMGLGEKYHFYKCLNGLVDVAVPIIIKGEHIANLFSGQFFFEKPDKSFFQKQAATYGFNETVYLKALEEVPVFSEERVKTIMEFLLNMTQLISDMTFQRLELIELNETLQANEERYRLLLENSMDAILLTSPDGAVLSANPAACTMFQRSEEDICRLGRNGIVDMSDPRLPVLIEERNRTGKAKGELQMLRKDGTQFPVELSTSVFTDQSGRLLSSMIIRDITERKNAEEQLVLAKEKIEESEMHFRLLVENAPEAIFIQVDSDFAYLNKAAIHLYGALNEEQLLGTRVIDRIHTNFTELTTQRIKQLNEQQLSVATSEYKHLKMDGSVIEVSVSAVPFKFQNKHGALVFVKDITDRKLAEELYKQKAEEINTFFDCAIDLLCIADTDGRFVRLNKEWENVLNIPTEELTGRYFIDFVHPDDKEATISATKRLAQQEEVTNFTNRYRCKDNTYKWIEWKAYSKDNRIYASARDITERIQQKQDLILAKEKTEKSEEKFRKAFYTNPEAITITIIETGTYISVNSGFVKMLEYTEEEILGHTSKELNIWQDIANRDYFISTLKKNGIIEDFETKFRTKSGKIIDALVSSVVIELDNIPHILSITRDITYRKKVENELRESKEQLHFAFEGSNDGLWDVDMKTGRVYISPRGCEILGYRPDETDQVAEVWSDLVHPDDLPLTNSNLQAHMENKTPVFEVEQRLRMKSGDWKWILSRGKVVSRDENGVPLRMTGTHTDISEQRASREALIMKNMELEASEEEIRATNEELFIAYDRLKRINSELEIAKEKAEENEKQINLFFNLVPDMIAIASSNGYFLSLNKIWEKVLGFTIEELKSKPFAEFIHPEDRERTFKEVENQLNKQFTINFINRYCCKDGSYRWLEWVAIPSPDGKNLYAAARDITERKRIENELINAKEKAEESDRLKTAFLQNMSHEIRTPMNAIMGFSELLVLNFNNKQKLEYFSAIINQRCNDLLDIINDLLDIAKIESGQLPVKIETCNISKLFGELSLFFTELQKRQKKQHIALNIHPGDPADIQTQTDIGKLKQIFINLIGNAFKFTNQGSIEVSYRIDDGQFITFFVADTGIGIPSDKHQIIFERFTQVEQGPNRLYGGTGLGLSIVKGLVDLLKGSLWLSSQPEEGTTFYFTIPLTSTGLNEPEENDTGLKHADYNFSNKTILVVEDDEINAEYLRETLSNTGLNLLHTEHGKDAVQLAMAHMPDLVLMDIGLPDMSGYYAIRQIKEHKPAIKIIAQTAYATDEDRKKAMDAGCIGYISKPLKYELLLSMIHKCLSDQ